MASYTTVAKRLWMHEYATWYTEVNIGAGHIVLDGFPAWLLNIQHDVVAYSAATPLSVVTK